MHRDVLAGRKFELASLTEFVVNEGLKYEMELPTYKMVLDNTGFQELINCCNAAKERVYPKKSPCFHRAVLFI
jgi:ketopantoate reductase